MPTVAAPPKPKHELRFTITGLVKEKESGLGVPRLLIRAYDKDLLFDDLLGSTTTDEEGRFEISYSEEDFRELFERQPDIYLTVYAPPRRRLMDTAKEIRWNAGEREVFELEIDRATLGDLSPVLPEDEVAGGISLARDALRIVRRDGLATLRLPGFVLGGPPGAPALPRQVRFVALPLGGDVLDLEVLPGEPVELRDIGNLMPVQEPIPDLGTDAEEYGDGFSIENVPIRFTQPDASIFEGDRPYPEELVELIGVEDAGPIRMAAVRLRPVQFDPRTRSLRYYPDLGFRLKFDREKARRTARERPRSKPGWSAHRVEILNEFLTCDVVHVARDIATLEPLILEDVPHVIVSDNYAWPESIALQDGSTRAPDLSERGAALPGDMIAEFLRLAEWKTSRGVRSRVVTVSDIVDGQYGDMTEGGLARDLQEVVRNFVKYAEDKWDTTYLLLGGDLNVVPMRRLVGSSTYGTIGCWSSASDPPPAGACHFLAGKSAVKLHPKFTPGSSDPLSTLAGALRIPFDREAGSGRLGWYYTDESSFNTLDEGFTRLPVGQTSPYAIVEGPEPVIEDSYYWVRSVNSIPSDLYYSSLVSSHYSKPGKHDFDDNNNGLYGQYDGMTALDKIDLWPDVYVGRASVETGDQAAAFVDKVITYERLETPDGQNAVDPTYLQKILYASAYWGREMQYRQTDTTVPPAEDKFTHVAGDTETKIHTGFDLVLIPGGADRRLVAHLAAGQVVVPYDTNASAAQLGWYFATNDTFTVQSAVPTRWVRVRGPEADIDPEWFFWDPVGLELAATEKENLRTQMNGWFSDFNAIERHYDDYFDLATPPPLVPLEPATVQAAIDNGVHFLSLTGHGSSSGCAGVYSNHDYTNERKYFIAFADSCSTAKPDGVDSLAELTTMDADGGAVAYVGNTRYSWIGIGDNYEEYFWSKLKTVGRLGPAAGLRLATDGVEYMWTTYAQTLFGDPEMRVWTAMPSTYEVTHPSTVAWGGAIPVTVRKLGLPLAGQTVTLLGGWTTTGVPPRVFESKVTESSGTVSFQLPSGGTPLASVRLTVSGRNFKPFVAEIQIS